LGHITEPATTCKQLELLQGLLKQQQQSHGAGQALSPTCVQTCRPVPAGCVLMRSACVRQQARSPVHMQTYRLLVVPACNLHTGTLLTRGAPSVLLAGTLRSSGMPSSHPSSGAPLLRDIRRLKPPSGSSRDSSPRSLRMLATPCSSHT
jgi:hypothetical protein